MKSFIVPAMTKTTRALQAGASPRKRTLLAQRKHLASRAFLFPANRTPHDSNAPSWAARKETSLARIMAHCTALAYLTGGDVPAASRDRKSRKRCYGRKPGGEFGQLRIGSDDYGSVQGQHLNR